MTRPAPYTWLQFEFTRDACKDPNCTMTVAWWAHRHLVATVPNLYSSVCHSVSLAERCYPNCACQ